MFRDARTMTQRQSAGSWIRGVAVFATPFLALSACESEVVALEEGEISLDASAPTNFVYLSLDAGAQVTPADPGSSTDWHMAFRRFSIRLNGGVAGPGSVSGYNVANNVDASAEQIAALTPQDGAAAFQAVTETDIPVAASFVEDGLAPDPGASWFRFDGRTQTLVANPGVAWKVREISERGYAIFRVTELQMQGQRPLGLTIEYRRQDPGGSLGSAQTVTADLSRGPAHVGFSGGADGVPLTVEGDGSRVTLG